MAKWDNDKIREYAINKELDLREVLQNHWSLTVEELKNETFQIIGE
jgi:hypothetical protein